MFGHDDNHGSNDTQQDGGDAVASQGPIDAAPPAEPVEDGTLGAPAPDDPVLSAPAVDDDKATNDTASDTPAALSASAQSASLPTPFVGATSSVPAPSGNGLLGIKQEALGQLKPLVGHLDQTPEEKFRTTMMMIQAADDQTLINDAYAAAKNISDEKTRAQALLDIINEINYFTSQKS